MFECGVEAMDRTSTQGFHFCYTGAVLFGAKGSLEGVCIGVDNDTEGEVLLEYLAKLNDAFRCLMDFRSR